MPAVLVDASAFVALVDRSDHHHKACVAALSSVTEPLVTTWPVLTEAMYLLSDSTRAQQSLFEMIEDGAITLTTLDESDLSRMKTLMRKYADLPMDFGDASLVRVAERERLTRVLTFDKHFSVYALPGRARFVLLTERSQP